MLSTFTVNSAADDGSIGTLRWAIEQANATTDPDEVNVTPNLTITLAQGVLNVTTPISISSTNYFTINGLTIVSPGNFSQTQIFNVTSSLDLTYVVLTGGGATSGGAITNSGTLVATNCQFTGNDAGLDGNGGAINNTGTMTLNNCIFLQNTAGQGGAIYNTGTAALVNSTLGFDPSVQSDSSNESKGDGGALYNAANATMTLDGCYVENNVSNGGNGGAIFNDSGASLTVRTSFVDYNRAAGNGGAINSNGTLTVSDSYLTNNTAVGGGGIMSWSTLTMNKVWMESNQASLDGGAVNLGDNGTANVTACSFRNNTAGQDGGAIRNGIAQLSLSQSTMWLNHASRNGGALFSFGLATLTNCTIYKNTATQGGGVYAAWDTCDGFEECFVENYMWLYYCTLSENSATGVYAEVTVVTLTNTIVAWSGGFDLGEDSTGEILGDYNLISDGIILQRELTHSRDGDPMLGNLQDNGGPTWTMALRPGSPAIDLGTNVDGVTIDQRGVTRPQGAAPDVGAFESRGFQASAVSSPPVGDSPHPVAPIGTPFSSDLIVRMTSPFGEPVAGGIVTFIPSASGPSAVFENGGKAFIDANGFARITATANRVPGTHTIVTHANGANSVAFTHTNIMPNFHGVWRGVSATPAGRRRAVLARLDLSNPGTVTTRGAGVKLYASSDGVLDDTDQLVAFRRAVRLRPGARQLIRWKLGPRQLQPGHHLIAVLDARHSVDGSGPRRLFHPIAWAPNA